ncbi:MAPEG family protein [Sphingomonas sp. M1-B02]|uniref:MAPEG family protein n=1 Tax=Sphingomonas sp. M1-B02 TaxID=3114300 RepID=UPI00224010B8|nr:MAPEG family protein [Sphingomonas sp. S6-11]UZK65263.1 MAPEG family protein [Sphingomonas sp. S6-11]
MFFLPVALVTAGAAALINFWLGLRISQLRISEKILVGDGGNPRMVARMRAHLNFAEYAPIVLILIALVEMARGTQYWLWIVAAVFIVGRVLHGFGMDGWRIGRMLGILSTMLVMLGLAAYAVYLGYTGLSPLR